MIPWQERPKEIAFLLNPAFCGELICICIKSYHKTISYTFPYILSFLVLPIVLHRRTRESIPRKARLHMHAWLQENQYVKIGFADRARLLAPITKETLAFLLKAEAIKLDEQGGIVIRNYKCRNNSDIDDEEILDCFHKAQIIGRWLARSGSLTTIFAMWGVKP
ncbi:MAG: DUF6521 family protein [Bacillus sp. (in: Bacteria)]|nr:DUF6521 family protein [Bacillus sp. (in: firmicutes)]